MTEVSKEYATALFALAMESSSGDAFAEALQNVAEVLKNNPEYRDFLASPGIVKRERTESLEKVFGGKIPEYVLSYIQLLCEKGHIIDFDRFVESYMILYRESKNISKARVISAVELTDEEKLKLKRKLEVTSGRTVTVEYSIDSSLLGGMVVYIDDKVMDGSVKRRLQDIKEVMDR